MNMPVYSETEILGKERVANFKTMPERITKISTLRNRISPKYLKIQSLPQRKYKASPLQRLLANFI
jgi:hypothetical protein